MSKRAASELDPEDGRRLEVQGGTPAKRSRVGSTEAEFAARRIAETGEGSGSRAVDELGRPQRQQQQDGLDASTTTTTATANSSAPAEQTQEQSGVQSTDLANRGGSNQIGDNDNDDNRDDEEVDEPVVRHTKQTAPEDGYRDLYLDTINRAVLDFEFEKLCSVTLSNINVYSCLVCGKYFQGRGPHSPAYFHSLDEDHHVWINMQTQKVYVLPEGYEVRSGSLDDIKYVVDPTYTRAEVARLDRRVKSETENGVDGKNQVTGPNSSGHQLTTTTHYDLEGRPYTPGFVGLNNIKANDYVNVIVHVLAHVGPLRNFFMLEDLRARSELAQRFGVMVRKIWNGRAFKAHVSPHELLQAITDRSRKRFSLTKQSDPADLLLWLVNELHLGLGGSRTKPGSSIVHQIFQGRMEVRSEVFGNGSSGGAVVSVEGHQAQPQRPGQGSITPLDAHGSKAPTPGGTTVVKKLQSPVEQTSIRPFLVLTLDLPPAPLFTDEVERNIIPQVPLVKLLAKYDGAQVQEGEKDRRRFRLVKPLPPFLLLHIKRFSANRFVEERNRTIVTFNPRGLDLGPYAVSEKTLDRERRRAEERAAKRAEGGSDGHDRMADVDDGKGESTGGDDLMRDDEGDDDVDDDEGETEEDIYDLVANVTHEAVKSRDDSVSGEREKKVWSVQLLDKSRDSWVEVQDLFVSPAASETLFTKESYIQVWERRRAPRGGKSTVRGAATVASKK